MDTVQQTIVISMELDMNFLRTLALVPFISSCGLLTNPQEQNSEVFSSNGLPERLLGEDISINAIFADQALQDPICADLPPKVPIIVEKELGNTIYGVIPVVKDGMGNPVCKDWEGNPITRGYFRTRSTVLSSTMSNSAKYCPYGSSPEKVSGIQICTMLNDQGTQIAVGPFPKQFTEKCKQQDGGPACEGASLNAEFVRNMIKDGGISSDRKCIKGARWSTEHDACFDGTNAFGPFTLDQVKECYRYIGGTPCVTLRWHGSFVKKPVIVTPEKKPGKSKGAYFNEYYDTNYYSVSKRAKQFWPNSFGCAAFASTALKMAGFKIKQVLITNEVESQLKRLGWKKITNMAALKPGDVVFTDKQTSNVPGTWSHVYVFHKYHNSKTAIVNDNYGKRTKRNIYGSGKFSVSKIAYRAPN